MQRHFSFSVLGVSTAVVFKQLRVLIILGVLNFWAVQAKLRTSTMQCPGCLHILELWEPKDISRRKED